MLDTLHCRICVYSREWVAFTTVPILNAVGTQAVQRMSAATGQLATVIAAIFFVLAANKL
jgi:hypothetical protein